MSKNWDADQWREKLAEYEESGLTQRSWCSLEGVGLHQLYYWRRRLRSSLENQGATVAMERWFPMEVVPDSEQAQFEGLRIPSVISLHQRARQNEAGLTLSIGPVNIQVGHGFDVGLLQSVVMALTEGSC